MKVVSDLREAMWGMLPTGIFKLDIDFQSYARKPFDRMEPALHSWLGLMA
ncbi:MAG: hypothetical protein ABSF61_13880 [Anaerolineales bacterium]|jgi:hypothetical protein